MARGRSSHHSCGVEIREPSGSKINVVLRTKINGDCVAKIVISNFKINFSATAQQQF